MILFIKYVIFKLIVNEFEKNFLENLKDEYIVVRWMKRKFYIYLGDINIGKIYNVI